MTDPIPSLDAHSAPVRLEGLDAEVILISRVAPGKATGNEDATGCWSIDRDIRVLAVADGLGGTPGGATAAGLAITCMEEAVTSPGDPELLRSRILDAFEEANRRVLEQGIGSGTTLVVAEVFRGTVRTYHAGDSGALLVGQRGRIRLETMPHSPVGYGVAAGILDPAEAPHHEERHLLSNCIGSREMRVEVGTPTPMGARDTLLLATDGILDNVRQRWLVDTIRKGPLIEAAGRLQERVARTMRGEDPELPALPDDATALLHRLEHR